MLAFSSARIARASTVAALLLPSGACRFERDALRATRDGQAEARDGRSDTVDTLSDAATDGPERADGAGDSDAAAEPPTDPGKDSTADFADRDGSPGDPDSPTDLVGADLPVDEPPIPDAPLDPIEPDGPADDSPVDPDSPADIEEPDVLPDAEPDSADAPPPAAGWTDRTVPWPKGQYLNGVTYDATRGLVLFFGGSTGGNGLWEWEGASGGWKNRTPSPLPSPWPSLTARHAMAYDAVRGRVVVAGNATCGTTDAGPSTCFQTWEWDGVSGTWIDRTPPTIPASWPAARSSHMLAYDPSRARVVMIGNATCGTTDAGPATCLQTWEWDGAGGTWSSRTPSVLPPSWPAARTGHALTFDSARAKVLLFGGTSGGDEIWEWDGTSGSWSSRTFSPRPPTWPSSRTGAGFAFDSDRSVAIVFGGVAGTTTLTDVWEWNGMAGTWSGRTPAPLPDLWPSGRYGVVYDAGRKFIFAFTSLPGGCSTVKPEAWEWEGTGGTWTRRVDGVPPRMQHAMAYDAGRGRLVLFGGWSCYSFTPPNYTFFGDLWEWESSSGTWFNRTPSPLPSEWPMARYRHAMAYDAGRGRVVLFGGYLSSFGTQSSELWEWNGTDGSWTNRTPSPLPASWPPASSPSAMAPDILRDRIVLVTSGSCGTPDAGMSSCLQTWELNPAAGTWASRTPSPLPPSWPPPSSGGPPLVYDFARNRILMVIGASCGSTDAGTISCMQTWEWDGAGGTWTSRTPAPLPPSWPTYRSSFSLAYDATRKTTVLFGGTIGATRSSETWEWDGTAGTWTSRTLGVLPPSWPAARSSHALAYDSGRGAIVLFGGTTTGTNLLNDTWEWLGP